MESSDIPPDSPTQDSIGTKHSDSENSDFNPRFSRIKTNDIFTDEELEEQPIIVKSTPVKERKSRSLKKYRIPLKSKRQRHPS